MKNIGQIRKPIKQKQSLIQDLLVYPNKGIGFKVWERGQLPDNFWIVKHMYEDINGDRSLYGVKYENGVQITGQI